MLNHAVTAAGLTLFQMYVMGVDFRRKTDHAERVEAARMQFDALMPPVNGVPQQPDLVVLQVSGCNHTAFICKLI